MPKKIMTVRLGEEDEGTALSETSKIIESNLIKPQAEMLQKRVKELKRTSAKPKGPLLSAEQVTKIAMDFLKGLGNKFVMPKRVMKEGERNYTVELDLKGRIASVFIDRSTREIIEYEIKEARKEVPRGRIGEEGGGGSFFSPGTIILVVVMQIILMVVFNFLKLYVDIPFLTGPPTA